MSDSDHRCRMVVSDSLLIDDSDRTLSTGYETTTYAYQYVVERSMRLLRFELIQVIHKVNVLAV